MRTILLIAVAILVLFVLVSVISRARSESPKKLTSAEKKELNAARDLLADLHRSASEVSNEQPFGYIVMDEINTHNRKVRELS